MEICHFFLKPDLFDFTVSCFWFPRCVWVAGYLSFVSTNSFFDKSTLRDYEQKFGKRKMADSDFNFFFKNPKYPLGNPPFCLWNHQKWFWGPKIAPLSFSQKFWKNITPHVFAPSTLNFCPIFKCHTILESWRVAGFDGTKILWGKFMTNEKSALEIWLSRGL